MKKDKHINKRLKNKIVNDNCIFEPSIQLVAGARNHLVLLFSAIGLAEQRLMA